MSVWLSREDSIPGLQNTNMVSQPSCWQKVQPQSNGTMYFHHKHTWTPNNLFSWSLTSLLNSWKPQHAWFTFCSFLKFTLIYLKAVLKMLTRLLPAPWRLRHHHLQQKPSRLRRLPWEPTGTPCCRRRLRAETLWKPSLTDTESQMSDCSKQLHVGLSVSVCVCVSPTWCCHL